MKTQSFQLKQSPFKGVTHIETSSMQSTSGVTLDKEKPVGKFFKLRYLTVVMLIFAAGFSLQSCFHFSFPSIVGSGAIVTREFPFSSFDAVSANTVIDVEIVQGTTFSVIAEGHENIMDFLDLKVVGGKLYIDLISGSYSNFKMKVFVSMPTVTKLYVNSTGNMYVSQFTNLPSLEVTSNSTGNFYGSGTFDVSGLLKIENRSTGNISIDVICDEIIADLSSTGNVTLKGSCQIQGVRVNGTGNYNAFDLTSKDCTVTTNSTGDARVFATDKLSASIRSVGSIYYKGSPTVSFIDSGIGKLIWAD
jgi:hypothetical protein